MTDIEENFKHRINPVSINLATLEFLKVSRVVSALATSKGLRPVVAFLMAMFWARVRAGQKGSYLTRQ